ncbi:MAG: hypothetical protein LBQ88_05345 [Treponema sp.]|jgi:hypothetical protein|nr:hypothetical protein [Treponema sp.]
MTKKYRVTLTSAERELLEDILNRGKHSARKRKQAQALMLADQQMADEAIPERAGMYRRGIENLRLIRDTWITLEGTDTKRVSIETTLPTLNLPV